MFKALGVNWAGTLLGCVGLVLVPIPIFFYKYGARIRQKSKFAPGLDLMAGAGAGESAPVNGGDELADGNVASEEVNGEKKVVN